MKTIKNNLIHLLCRPKIIGVILMLMLMIMIVFYVSNITLKKRVHSKGDMLLGVFDLSNSGEKVEYSFDLPQNITLIRLVLVIKNRELPDLFGEDIAFSDSPLILQYEILDSSGRVVFDETVAGYQMRLTNWYNPDWSAVINKDFGKLDDKLVCGNKYHIKIKVVTPWKSISKAQVYLSYVK